MRKVYLLILWQFKSDSVLQGLTDMPILTYYLICDTSIGLVLCLDKCPVLQVNRSLRAPISSQLIFMPGNTATAAVATVTQQPQAQQQQQEVTQTSSSSSQSDNDQVCVIVSL